MSALKGKTLRLLARTIVPAVRFAAALVLVAFALNWLWEMLQMPAYAEMADLSWRQTLPRCTVAAGWDVLLTLAVYAVGALVAGRWWWAARRWYALAAAGILGGTAGVALEWRALAAGRWAYTDRMPLVPLLGVGLWPVLQLAFLVPVALAAAALAAAKGGSDADLSRGPEL